jgi:hypothetical protein
MAVGIYGTQKGATFDIENDVEIFWAFQSNRNAIPNAFQAITPSSVLSKIDEPDNIGQMMGGLYNLTLPTSISQNGIGFYYMYIRPKKIKVRILDCGILEGTGTKGIIIDTNQVPENENLFLTNNGLSGFKIEYLNTNTNAEEKLVFNTTKIITGNYLVEAISSNINNNSQKNLRYRLNNNSTLVFLTVTPSTESDINGLLPFIGEINQEIEISNTFFEETLVEIELTEYDEQTLGYGLYGDQIFNYTKGTRTIFDDDGNIFKQFTEYTEKNDVDEPIRKVKKEKDIIDFSEDIDNV